MIITECISMQLRVFYMVNILKYERYRVSVNLSVYTYIYNISVYPNK